MVSKIDNINENIVNIKKEKTNQENKIKLIEEELKEEKLKVIELDNKLLSAYKEKDDEIKNIRNSLLKDKDTMFFQLFNIEYSFSYGKTRCWICVLRTNKKIGLVISCYDDKYTYCHINSSYISTGVYIVKALENVFEISYVPYKKSKIIGNDSRYEYDLSPINDLPDIPDNIFIKSEKLGLLLKLYENDLYSNSTFTCDKCTRKLLNKNKPIDLYSR